LVEGGVTVPTDTVTDCVTDPPLPVQESVYVVLAVGDTDCEPDIAFVPLHPPDAVHDEALVELHESVEDCPDVIDVGLAESERVGADDGGGVYVPPPEITFAVAELTIDLI